MDQPNFHITMADCSSDITQRITRMELFEFLLDKKLHNHANSVRSRNHLCDYVASRIPDAKDINKTIISFTLNLMKYWHKYGRKKQTLLNECGNWLRGEIFKSSLPLQRCTQEVTTDQIISCHNESISVTPVQTRKDFNTLNLTAKRRRTNNLVCQNTADELIFAAQTSFNKEGKRNMATVLKKVATASPRSLRKMRRFNGTYRKPVPYTPEEALALIIDAKLTIAQYRKLKKEAKKRNCDIYPSYERILLAKKECYPENITITETKGEVLLQSLLDHSVRRLAIVQNDTITRVINDYSTLTLELKSKWGFDGSSNHSMYKQKFSDSTDANDSDMFLTSVVPLQLVAKNGTSDIIVWQNPRPSSTRFALPIRCQFVKETREVIKYESEYINRQISALIPTELNINGKKINIHHVLMQTMLDGKAANILSDNISSQSCYICHATPNQMNDIDAVVKRSCNMNAYSYGLSILHAHIRLFECILHIAYRLESRTWRVQTCDKAAVAEKKRKIIEDFRRRTGLLVDVVKQGSGNTNDGNTARRFFQNTKIAAEITGVDENLIVRFSIILKTLSCNFEINTEAFREYSIETAKLYVTLYPWYKMPASLHKLLIHGSDVMDSLILPIGQLSEEALEARHRDCRNYRLNHSRKTGRKENVEDMFHSLLVSSDLMISNIRPLSNRKTKSLPKEVIKLLKIPEPPTNTIQESSDDSSSDD